MKKSIYLIISSFVIFACSSQKKMQKNDAVQNYIAIAENVFKGKSIEYFPNSDSTIVLCLYQEQAAPQTPRNKINYLVVDRASGNVLLENSLVGGSIKWYDKEHLEIFRIPGTMAQGQSADDYTEILNINTKSAVPKSSLEK